MIFSSARKKNTGIRTVNLSTCSENEVYHPNGQKGNPQKDGVPVLTNFEDEKPELKYFGSIIYTETKYQIHTHTDKIGMIHNDRNGFFP